MLTGTSTTIKVLIIKKIDLNENREFFKKTLLHESASRIWNLFAARRAQTSCRVKNFSTILTTACLLADSDIESGNFLIIEGHSSKNIFIVFADHDAFAVRYLMSGALKNWALELFLAIDSNNIPQCTKTVSR